MEKNLTVKDKIFAFLEEKGISKTEFYTETGIEPSNFKGKNKESLPGSAMLVKILTRYPDLSADWLLTGQGEMLKQNVPSVATSGINAAEDALSFSDKDTKKTGNTQENSEKKSQISFDPNIGTPYYDVDFIGGFSEIFNDQTTLPACNVVVPGLEKAQLWCNVTGHSMEPKINPGDIIALRECRIDDIQYGEIYAVVLDTIRTIKILRRGTTPDTLLFVPINKPDYEEQEFEASRIIRVFEVLGSVARFF